MAAFPEVRVRLSLNDPILTSEVDEGEPLRGGPKDLAEVMLARRRQLGGGAMAAYLFGDLTEDEVHTLIRCAYELSFRKDEGRYAHLAIVVPTRAETHLHESAVLTFNPPVPLDVRTLRRLSAAVPPRPQGLMVKGGPQGLVCTAIGRFETPGALLREDQTGLYMGSDGLLVEVNGPGDLSVREAKSVHTLRAGTIQRQFDGNEAVKRIEHFDWLRDEVIQLTVGQADDRIRGKVSAAIRDAWLFALKETVALAHGGAFAVLPTDAGTYEDLPAEWKSKIALSYPTASPDFLEPICHYVTSHWGGGGGLNRQEAVNGITDAAAVLAHLSATDGFVLLNQRLRVLGFGAKIGWDQPIPQTCDEVDDELAPTGGRLALMRVGLRHTAAFRLCQAVPGAMVFLASQDGELRVFHPRPGGGVQVTAPLEPVTLLFQGM